MSDSEEIDNTEDQQDRELVELMQKLWDLTNATKSQDGDSPDLIFDEKNWKGQIFVEISPYWAGKNNLDAENRFTFELFREKLGKEYDWVWMKLISASRINISSTTMEWDSRDDRIDEAMALTNVIHLEHMIRYLLFEESGNRAKIAGKGAPNPRNMTTYQSEMRFDSIEDEWMSILKSDKYKVQPGKLGLDNLPKPFENQMRDVFYTQWGAVLLDWIDGFHPFMIHHKATKLAIENYEGDHKTTVIRAIQQGLKLRRSIEDMADELADGKKIKLVHNELKSLRNQFSTERAKLWESESSVTPEKTKQVNSLYGKFRNDAFTIGLTMALAYYRQTCRVLDPYEWRQKSLNLLNHMNEYWRTNKKNIENLYSLKSVKKGKYPKTQPFAGEAAEAAYWKSGAKGDQVTRYPIHRHLFLEIMYCFEMNDKKVDPRAKTKFDNDLKEARREFFFEQIYNGDHAKAAVATEDRLKVTSSDAKRVVRFGFSAEIKKRIYIDLDKIYKAKVKSLKEESKVEEVEEETDNKEKEDEEQEDKVIDLAKKEEHESTAEKKTE